MKTDQTGPTGGRLTAGRSAGRNAAAKAPRPTRRRGVASLVAMLYLIVFAALALGFYAQTNIAVQVSNNERRTKEALASAEAGLQYIRYELSRITIPMMPLGTPQLTNDQVFEEVWSDLKALIETNGSNLENGDTVSDIIYDIDPTDGTDPPRIEIPRQIPSKPARYMRMTESGPWFRVVLEQSGRDMIVTTVGKSASGNTASAGRGVQVRFRAKEWPNKVFDHGLASPGPVSVTVAKMVVQGTPSHQASILSTYTAGVPVTIGNASSTVAEPTGIAGNITLMDGAPKPSYVGANYIVGGLKTAATINATIDKNELTEPPEWPTPDVTIFTKYATTRYNGAASGTFDNIYVDPAFTPTVTFNQNHILRGVLYIKKGASVTFSGAVNLQCVIVGEPTGTIVGSHLQFAGNGVAKLPLSSLPPATTHPQFAGLHELSGIFILAPKWEVTMAGNFVSAAGSVVAEKITFTGNSPASITGSLINLGPYPLSITGSSSLSLTDPKLEQIPGVRFTERFAPSKGSYKEVNGHKFAKAS